VEKNRAFPTVATPSGDDHHLSWIVGTINGFTKKKWRFTARINRLNTSVGGSFMSYYI
jgi:hypothetical protein